MKQTSWFYAPSIVLSLCLLSEASASQSTFDAGERVVSFAPNIVLPPGAKCQGLRVNQLLVATSPRCVQRIRETIRKETYIDVIDPEENVIGSVSSCNKSIPARIADTNLFVVMHPNNDYPSEPAYYTGKHLPDKTFAYFLGEQNTLSIEEVFLTDLPTLKRKKYWAIESEKPLPEGVPVYDANGHIVCLIISEGECHALPDDLIQPARSISISFNFSIDTPKVLLAIVGGVMFLVIKNGGISIIKAGAMVGAGFIGAILTTISAVVYSNPEVLCPLTGCEGGDCSMCQLRN